jgi:hypothetical protein
MKVTVKLSDQLIRVARRRAADAGVCLSSWIVGLIQKELYEPPLKNSQTLLDALGEKEFSGIDIDFSRTNSTLREVDL